MFTKQVVKERKNIERRRERKSRLSEERVLAAREKREGAEAEKHLWNTGNRTQDRNL